MSLVTRLFGGSTQAETPATQPVEGAEKRMFDLTTPAWGEGTIRFSPAGSGLGSRWYMELNREFLGYEAGELIMFNPADDCEDANLMSDGSEVRFQSVHLLSPADQRAIEQGKPLDTPYMNVLKLAPINHEPGEGYPEGLDVPW